MRAVNWRKHGATAVCLLTSLAACSTRPAVPEYPELPPAPLTVVVNRFHLDRPDSMPARVEQDLPCPEHLEIDPVTLTVGNDPLLRAWTDCKAALAHERALRRNWESWEDREREAQRRARVTGTEEAGS